MQPEIIHFLLLSVTDCFSDVWNLIDIVMRIVKMKIKTHEARKIILVVSIKAFFGGFFVLGILILSIP